MICNVLLFFNIALVMNVWNIFICIYIYFKLINSIIYLFEMSHLNRNGVIRGVVCTKQVVAQFLAVAQKNNETVSKGLMNKFQ